MASLCAATQCLIRGTTACAAHTVWGCGKKKGNSLTILSEGEKGGREREEGGRKEVEEEESEHLLQ